MRTILIHHYHTNTDASKKEWETYRVRARERESERELCMSGTHCKRWSILFGFKSRSLYMKVVILHWKLYNVHMLGLVLFCIAIFCSHSLTPLEVISFARNRRITMIQSVCVVSRLWLATKNLHNSRSFSRSLFRTACRCLPPSHSVSICFGCLGEVLSICVFVLCACSID